MSNAEERLTLWVPMLDPSWTEEERAVVEAQLHEELEEVKAADRRDAEARFTAVDELRDL